MAGPDTITLLMLTLLQEKREAVSEPMPVAEPEVQAREAVPEPMPVAELEVEAREAEAQLVKRPAGPPAGFPHPKCGEHLCVRYTLLLP